MQIHNFAQGTPEWLAVRKGKMTASHAQAIANQGKGLDTYIYQLMSEQYSSGEKDYFSNRHIERGNELEGLARELYALQNDVLVEQVGFIEHSEFVGCSPDGLVGEEGGIEIKCKDDFSYFKNLINGDREIESAYVWQIQMNLLITQRKWWDYVAYNPNFKQSLIITRFYPDEIKFQMLLDGFELGKSKIEQIKFALTYANH